MKYLKAFESNNESKTYEGLFKSYKKSITKNDIKMSLIELEDMGFTVDIKNKKSKTLITIHKGNTTGIVLTNYDNSKFDIDQDIEDILFTFIDWIKQEYKINSKITLKYEWNPAREMVGETELKINNIKDWNKKNNRYCSKFKDIYYIEILLDSLYTN